MPDPNPAPTPNPGAPAGTPTPTPGGTPNPAPTPTDWMTGLSDELKGYVQTKGFKDPGAVLDSYRNFEKLHGVPQDRLLKLPENMDSPEGRAIYERIGAPKEAGAYSINIPKENGDQKLADGLREVAFKQGFSQRQVEGLVNWWNERQDAGRKAYADNETAAAKAAETKLRQDWGAAFEDRSKKADEAAKALNLGDSEMKALASAIGRDKAMELLYKIGSATGEAPFITSQNPPTGALTPEQARAQIQDMERDSGFIKRLMAKDTDAMRQWNKAHEYAFPGMQQL